MTIRVSPERSTLSLLSSRLRAEDARGSAPAAKAAPSSAAPVAQAKAKPADVGQLRAATAMLDRASSIADTALAAADTLTKLLEGMRDLAAKAREGSDQGRDEFRNLGELVSQTVKAAIFDSVNLLDGSQGGSFRVSTGSDDDGELTLGAFDLFRGEAALPVETDRDPASAFEAVEAALADMAAVRERLMDDSKRVEAHRSFVSLLADAVGSREPESSLDVEGARLSALQLRQSLGGERFSIANQAPQTVLALFR